jgi:hypothetical protein
MLSFYISSMPRVSDSKTSKPSLLSAAAPTPHRYRAERSLWAGAAHVGAREYAGGQGGGAGPPPTPPTYPSPACTFAHLAALMVARSLHLHVLKGRV